MLTVEHPSLLDDPDLISAAKTLLNQILDEFPSPARALADVVRLRTRNRFTAEWRAAASRIGVDWRGVALANVSYDLAIMTIGCSTMALATAEGPVLARNLDWWPERPLARAAVGMWCQQGAWFSAGWPGFSGIVTGMSRRGFALALNAVTGPESHSMKGYPVLLHLRRVLEDAADFDAALRALEQTTLAACALITLVGRDNHERAIIERSPRRAAIRRPQADEPLIVTNDYRMLFETRTRDDAEIYQTTCARFDALTVLSGELDPSAPVEDERLLDMLTDRDVIQGITVQHTILRPVQQVGRVFVPAHWLE